MEAFVIKQARVSDFPIIQKIFEQAPNYFMQVEGELPRADTVPYEFESRPEHIPMDNKRTYLVLQKTEAIGYIDAILGHPSSESACIGLFLLIENCQRKGLGRKVYLQWEKMFVEQYKPKFIRLWVAEENDVRSFWTKLGYQFDGVVKDYKVRSKTIKNYELEKHFSET